MGEGAGVGVGVGFGSPVHPARSMATNIAATTSQLTIDLNIAVSVAMVSNFVPKVFSHLQP